MIDVLVVLLVVLPPLDWAAAMILGLLAIRNPQVVTLRERAVTAALLAFAATVAGFIAWARLGVVTVDREAAAALVALALVLVSAPALYWLALLLSGRFRDGEA